MKSLDDSLIEEMQILSSFTSQTHSKHLCNQRSCSRTEKTKRKWNSCQIARDRKKRESEIKSLQEQIMFLRMNHKNERQLKYLKVEPWPA